MPACPGERQERARVAFHDKEGEKEGTTPIVSFVLFPFFVTVRLNI